MSLSKSSATPVSSGLARKLGIKPGMTILLRGAPTEFPALLAPASQGLALVSEADGQVDCALVFVRSKAEVQAAATEALRAAGETGLLWFAYPKKTGRLKSDLSRDSGWEPVYAGGFDSVAQVSIDETWTGFRFRPKHLVGRR